MRMRTSSLAAALSAAGFLLGACDNSASPDEETPVTTCLATTTVTLLDLGFVPACVYVSPGTTLTFRNADTIIHTVASNSSQDAFDSGLLAPGQEYSHTFRSTAGKVYVYCALHPSTLVTIVVE